MAGSGYIHDGDVWEISTVHPAYIPAPDLAEVLEKDMGYTIASNAVHFDFTIADGDFWDVLTKVDAFNAPALIELYYDDPTQITRLFINYEIEHLLRDNTRLVEAAQKHQVPIEQYLELYLIYYKKHRTEDELIRVFEMYEEFSDSKYSRAELLPKLLYGRFREEDIRIIGHRLLEKYKSLSNLELALNNLQCGIKNDYTAHHIRQILTDHYPYDNDHNRTKGAPDATNERIKFSRIGILLHIGGDRALAVKNPAQVAKLLLSAWRGEDATRTDELFIEFADRLASLTSSLPSYDEVSELCDSGVDVEFVAEKINSGSWTIRSIAAAYDGAPVPLASGWL